MGLIEFELEKIRAQVTLSLNPIPRDRVGLPCGVARAKKAPCIPNCTGCARTTIKRKVTLVRTLDFEPSFTFTTSYNSPLNNPLHNPFKEFRL